MPFPGCTGSTDDCPVRRFDAFEGFVRRPNLPDNAVWSYRAQSGSSEGQGRVDLESFEVLDPGARDPGFRESWVVYRRSDQRAAGAFILVNDAVSEVVYADRVNPFGDYTVLGRSLLMVTPGLETVLSWRAPRSGLVSVELALALARTGERATEAPWSLELERPPAEPVLLSGPQTLRVSARADQELRPRFAAPAEVERGDRLNLVLQAHRDREGGQAGLYVHWTLTYVRVGP